MALLKVKATKRGEEQEQEEGRGTRRQSEEKGGVREEE